MAFVYKKTMVILSVILAIFVALFSLFWYFFGGKSIKLKNGGFVRRATEKTNKETKNGTEMKKEEKIAIIYSDSVRQGVREVIVRTGNFDFVKEGDKVDRKSVV